MPTLHVRNVPRRLYDGLARLAVEHGRSITTEVIALLEESVEQRDRVERSRQALARLRKIAKGKKMPRGESVVDWIREDRDR
jgi:plasmid stability protein